MALDADLQTRCDDYRRDLDALGAQGRLDFVDIGRRCEDWPQPADRYLAGHATKWGRGRKAGPYAQWAYDIKNAPGVHVYAYIHPVHRNRGLAFLDPAHDVVVLFDCEASLNRDCFTPSSGARQWVADKTATGTHWRLRDTER